MVAKAERKTYEPPKLVVYGDLQRLTLGATGTRRDGGSGSTKSKATGTA